MANILGKQIHCVPTALSRDPSGPAEAKDIMQNALLETPNVRGGRSLYCVAITAPTLPRHA